MPAEATEDNERWYGLIEKEFKKENQVNKMRPTNGRHKVRSMGSEAISKRGILDYCPKKIKKLCSGGSVDSNKEDLIKSSQERRKTAVNNFDLN